MVHPVANYSYHSFGNKRLKYFPIFLLLLLSGIWGCGQENLSRLNPFLPETPQAKPIIKKDLLKSNGSFMIGYRTGRILSYQVLLEWQAANIPDFVSYQIFRDNRKRGTITDPGTVTFTDHGLKQDTYYNYKVAVFNKGGMFSFDTVRIKTPRFLPPLITGFEYINSTHLKLKWENRAELVEVFEIFRRNSTQPDSPFVQMGTSQNNFFVDATVSPDGNYFYRVKAKNFFEATPLSPPFFIKYDYHLNAPTLSEIHQIGGSNYVYLSWLDNSNVEEGFHIYRSSDNVNFTLIDSVRTDTLQYVDRGKQFPLQIGVTYYYYVTAFRNGEESNPSDILNITIQPFEEQFVEIGWDSIGWAFPFPTHFASARIQSIYLKSELENPLYITRIGILVMIPPPIVLHHFTIRMKNTTADFFETPDLDIENLTECLQTDLTINSTGWVVIPLTTPFIYNGKGNLLVDFSFRNSSGAMQNGVCANSDTQSNRTVYSFPSNFLSDINYSLTNNGLSTYIPNIRFYTAQ